MAEGTEDQTKSEEQENDGREKSEATGRAGGEDSLKADLAGERKARQEAEAKIADFQKKLDDAAEASKSEHEKALDAARKEGVSDADKRWAERVVRTDVKAAAREKFADPADALAFLDLAKFKVDDEGNTDDKAIATALDKLLDEKPHLGKTTRRTAGSADGGARGTATKGVNMNDLLRQAARR